MAGRIRLSAKYNGMIFLDKNPDGDDGNDTLDVFAPATASNKNHE